jgi:tetratricopeptide (TPR) repeat protein
MRARKLLIIFISGLLISQAAFAAIWYESYGKAEKSLRDKQWAEAVRYLNEAIALKSDSNANARTYGVNFIPYFPYLKLGTAYYYMGQLEAASQALDREEQLQAIAASPSDLAELNWIRGLIKQALEAGAADEQKRIQSLVAGSLDEAGRAEAQGKLDEAVASVNRALAVDPKNLAAREAYDRLLGKVAKAEVQRQQESRAAALAKEGEDFLAAGNLQFAASKFTESLALMDSPEVRTHLEETQSRLRAKASAEPSPLSRQEKVAEALKSAKGLQNSGKFNEALAKLQDAVALDPSNEDVRILQRTLVADVAKATEARAREGNITSLLKEAEKAFTEGNFEAALTGANRVRGLEPDNRSAIDLATRSIDSLNKRLLGKVSFVPKPVIIPFDRQSYQLPDGLLVERAYRRDYELMGSVNYQNEVTVRVRLEHFSRSQQEFRPWEALAGVDRGELLQATTRVVKEGNSVITQYAVQQALRPGVSVFSVSAEDPAVAGSVQTSRYLVYYVAPFYTNAWFLGSLGVLIAALFGGIYGRKRHRRSVQSKRRFNPYVAGAPVLQDDMFFGREELFKSILQSVHNNSIMLFGERRIGKTSFQHHLKKKLARLDDPEYSFYAVFIDLQGVPQDRFFVTLRDEIFRELAPLLGGAQPGSAPSDGSPYDYRELVDDIRNVLKILEARSAKKVKLVLQMDEVDQLNSYDPRINQRLRSLFMRNFSEKLAAVVSGVSIQKRWEGEGSPWYNFFEEIEVKPLRREDAAKLIERPIQGTFKLEKGVTDRIIEITDCKPYLIQKLCITLINRMHDEGRRTVTVADIDAVGRDVEL